MALRTVDVYLHASESRGYEIAQYLNLTGDAFNMCCHLGTEERITYEVDTKTGVGEVVAVNGRLVTPKEKSAE